MSRLATAFSGYDSNGIQKRQASRSSNVGCWREAT